MTALRTEHDALGAMEIPADALYGIHTQRAVENFPFSRRPVHPALIHAYGAVKLAAMETAHEITPWPAKHYDAICTACREMMRGALDHAVIVDALQGGAGTSTNMNVNEVLTNRALQLMDASPGQYDTLDPLDDLNRHQSTNDTYPTALHIAALQQLHLLEASLTALVQAFQAREQEWDDVVRMGRTQLQDAVPITMGRTMSAYAEALGRDRWRVFKCRERLRVVNLGGTAIGSGLGAPRAYIFAVVPALNRITGLGLARAENLVEATQNQDVFAEVSGILCACSVNLHKCANDLRILSSGPHAGIGELRLPPRQEGSSIMPGKVNPVIPEAVMQAAMAVQANHQAIIQACSQGSLELNPFLPLVADRLLESLDLLDAACRSLRSACIDDMQVNRDTCRRHIHTATATLTMLAGRIGHAAAAEIAAEISTTPRPLRDLLIERGLLTAEEFDALLRPERVLKLGSDETDGTPC